MKNLVFLAFILIPISGFAQNNIPDLKPATISSAIQNQTDRKKQESAKIDAETEYSLSYKDLINHPTYEKVFEVDNTKEELMKNIFNWYSVNKTKYGLSIISEDKDLGRVYIQVKKDISAGSDAERTGYLDFMYYFTIQVDCKDNKYRQIYSARQSQSLLKRGENPKNLSTESLTALKKQLEDVVEISQKYFDEKTRWEFNKSWNLFLKEEYTYNDLEPGNLLKSAISLEKEIQKSIYLEMIKKDDW